MAAFGVLALAFAAPVAYDEVGRLLRPDPWHIRVDEYPERPEGTATVYDLDRSQLERHPLIAEMIADVDESARGSVRRELPEREVRAVMGSFKAEVGAPANLDPVRVMYDGTYYEIRAVYFDR